ncbi:SDR family NAD(P)-dependent oxidoreductase [Nonomuraea sp. B12E4]|uniref:SDR family NAD(P)-dependent oxidoreductase n=1 Tax=Nonomuraea sp. B12E4 TaxID=3153564 RepID=UPI00325ED8C4
MTLSYVVTGGGRGIGKAVVERLLGEGGTVVAVERDPDALAWAGPRVSPLDGARTVLGLDPEARE